MIMYNLQSFSGGLNHTRWNFGACGLALRLVENLSSTNRSIWLQVPKYQLKI